LVIENALHEYEIQPAAELVADLGHSRYFNKSDTNMELNRRLVGTVDRAYQNMYACRPCPSRELF
jgi:hypothetical protein